MAAANVVVAVGNGQDLEEMFDSLVGSGYRIGTLANLLGQTSTEERGVEAAGEDSSVSY